ncbi:MAG: HEPN domain-containing protein [Thermoguttaceae bacterium]
MDKNDRQALQAYRLQRAQECLNEARDLLRDEHYNACVSRSYYAIFNALRAVMSQDGVDFKKHSAVISYFQKTYVKSGVFHPEISDMIYEAFSGRHESDYDDFYDVTLEKAKQQYVDAIEVVNRVREYLTTLLSPNV